MGLNPIVITFHVGLDFAVFVEWWSCFDGGQEGKDLWDWTSPSWSRTGRDLWDRQSSSWSYHTWGGGRLVRLDIVAMAYPGGTGRWEGPVTSDVTATVMLLGESVETRWARHTVTISPYLG